MTDGPLSVAPLRPDVEQRREARPAGDTRDAPSIIDTIVGGFKAARADTTGVVEEYQSDAYEPIINALVELQPGSNFTRYVNPATGVVSPEAVWRDVQRFRSKDRFNELPGTVQEFEKQWREKKRREIEAAEDVASRGNGIASFAGGVAGAMTDPVNLYTLPVGGGGKTVATRIITEGLVNMGVETVMLPTIQRNREQLGRRDLTVEEGALNVVMAGVGASVIRGGIELAPSAARVVGDNIVDPLRRFADPNFEDKQLARAFEQMVPQHLRTPEQDAALFVLRRQAEVEEVNPYVNTHEGIDAHLAKMDAALRALEEGRVAKPEELAGATSPVPAAPVARPVTGGGFNRAGVKAAIAGPESAGDDFAVNGMGSGASGRYQFMRDTFIPLYQKVYGVSRAVAAGVWNSRRRFDVKVQEDLMDRLLDENAAALQRAGIPVDDGNLYLAHFAGSGKAIELLRAPKDAPVSAFFSAKAIRQNPTYLGGGKTVGEAIAVIRGKVGDPGQASPAPIDPVLLEPELRDPALDAQRPATPLIDEKAADASLPEPVQMLIDPLREVVTGTSLSLNRTADLARELGTDEATLHEALSALVERGDITQNSATGKFMRKAAAPVTAANQRRPRTLLEFLAERGGLNDWGGDLTSRGIKPSQRAKGFKIIRNVRREDKTVIPGEGEWGLDRAFQAAREEGYFPEFDGRVEDTYGDAIDGVQVLLAAIDEELAGSPRYRMDDWDRLPEFKLTGSTEAIYGGRITAEEVDLGPWPVEQLIAGFRQAWEDFGNDAARLAEFDDDFLRRAAEFYDKGDAFLPEHALAMVATEDYERALAAAIREGLADDYPSYDPWNPEWDAEFERRFAAARARDRANADAGAGSAGERGDAGAGGQGGPEPRDGGQAREPSPAELDAAAAAKPRADHTDLPPDPDPRFAEADSPGIVAAAESAWHDIRQATEADPNVTARQRQEAQLGADAPMRATTEQDGTMGLGLFDSVDQKTLFDLGDGRGERTVADIRAELDADKAAIDTLRSCMT